MSTFFHAVRRKWYVAVAGLILTAGLGVGVSQFVQPEYTARGLILLIPPVEETGANPFLSIGGLELPARVLVAAYSSNAMQERIADRAPDAEVKVTMEEATRGPVIAVDVVDTSAEGALETLDFVVETIPVTLDQLQDDVNAPSNARATSIQLTMDTIAEPEYETLIRVMVLVVGGGLAVTVLAILLAENLSQRSARAKRASHVVHADDDESGASADAPRSGDDTDPDFDEITARWSDDGAASPLSVESVLPSRKRSVERRLANESDE